MNPDTVTFPIAPWRLLQDPPSRGAWNMAVDEAILEGVIEATSPPTLRLYAWEPACISLGIAQPFADIDRSALVSRDWDVVRRPTGGRAILHTDELTYAVIGPANDPRLSGNVLESYRRLSVALQSGLHSMDLPAEAQEKYLGDPDGSNPVCFEVPSNYEIVVSGKKLIGSAQARRKGGVLQHGSLPLYGDHTRLVQALNYANGDSPQVAKERLASRATTVEAALGRRITWEEAAGKFRTAFEEVLNLRLVPGELTAQEHERVEQLIIEKYAHPDWTERV